AGAHTISADYSGDATFGPGSGSVAQTVMRATPVIAWPVPAPIASGSLLGGAQLNATANVPGSFAYVPPAGTVLPAGNGQTLSVTFTPTDLANFTTTQATVSINVVVLPVRLLTIQLPVSFSSQVI